MSAIPIPTKNLWGAARSNIDQQRGDMFVVSLNYPAALGAGSANVWDSECAFAVEKFPFPPRDRDMIAIKYLNQTNHQIGADSATTAIEITVRYAFNRRTAELLEQWNWLISNPVTGGVAITSAVKSDGFFYWLVPDMSRQFDPQDISNTPAMVTGAAYYLEGCLPKQLHPSGADMTVGNALVTLTFGLQIDRYYPLNPSDLTINTSNLLSSLT